MSTPTLERPEAPAAADLTPPAEGTLELSVVMPCLNEKDTVAVCVRKALDAMAAGGVAGEVVVADNGSTDGSIELAAEAGARVVPVQRKGYGAALIGGIEASRGKYVLMGDADDSYDFGELMKFVEALRRGAELVQGCRLPRGGGTVMAGAMPPLHRWLGNPMLTLAARTMFKVPINDIYCGMRGFTRELYDTLKLQCTGMEFATEMTIKSALFRHRIDQVPITLHPDGRVDQTPHLRTFRDGWRTLRFFLLYSPKWLFLQPGKVMMVLGAGLFLLGLFKVTLPVFGGVQLNVHTMLVGGLTLLVGHQCIQLAIFGKTFVVQNRLTRRDFRLEKMERVFPLERGLLVAGALILAGLIGLLVPTVGWMREGFGELDYARTMPIVIAAATAILLGVQTALGSFFIGVLSLPRRGLTPQELYG
jgi:glycosyltransferase involved in cell wall biosynthesis